jgi:hypothetical protein
MSFYRLIYYSAVVGGWAAFLGWLPAEILAQKLMPYGGLAGVAVTCGLVGAAIGGGLAVLGGMANAQWKHLLQRFVLGLAAGGVGGIVGGVVGEVLFRIIGFRAIGWALMGAAIGIAEGLLTRSRNKARNGLIGGVIGGFLGGFLFEPIQAAISGADMTARAVGFVILGACIGILIGLVQVVLKQAWLSVRDGYRPGRELILGDGRTVLGRAEWAHLPFRGPSDVQLAPEQVVIEARQGTFYLKNNGATVPTLLNRQPLGPGEERTLSDGDLISFGGNSLKFGLRQRKSSPAVAVPAMPPHSNVSRPGPISPPSPVPEPRPAPGRVPHSLSGGASSPAAPAPEARPAISPAPPVPPPPPRDGPAVRPKPPTFGGVPAPPAVAPPRPAPAVPQPAPVPAARPAPDPPRPVVVPPAPRHATPAPAPTAPATTPNMCPRGHKVAKGERFCMICGEDF